MGDKEDYLTTYRVFFENFAATVNPEDQLPVNIAGYTITESELPGEVLYWTTQYLSEKQCPLPLLTPLLRIILDEVRVASKKQPADFGYKSDDSVYVALRLMQAVTARVNAVCLRYLDNSRLDSLPPPPPAHLQELKTVSAATKNSRRVMEDRHVEIGNLEAMFGIESSKPTSFYAVYDGHAGSAAATYCAAHLHQYLVESPHFATDLPRALRDAFLRTDSEFIRKSNQERACGGSTAVAVAVRGRQLHAAWAGDSLALLAKRLRLMQLVRPHKPSRQDEKDRITAGGGTVLFWGTWRVNGQLAVSRAIGDAVYKPYVTALPELATVDLDGDEDFVVVACDGLWDFVSEDDVALAVYRQLAADPDDLKAVTKRLILQAKRQGSGDNISIIVVFLKDPRDIVADNRPHMDLGLDNALSASLPPFAVEAAEACKRQMEAAPDNGVDHSDSDSEDLGPETAVDVDADADADDLDADAAGRAAPPTPPAHTVEASHIDGALADNVGESGEESEDEWNYFKGEGERSDRRSEADDPDEPPRSETPCQDNSAWESSSVDMNSSPLNPDAPVFIPGTGPVAGSDILLAESPRKPQPMDDIELPDVDKFQTEVVRRPAELLDLDNCDQFNGHHNVSFDRVSEQMNGNEKCLDSLGFGFGVGLEPDKAKDINLIQDFERIQKDTTDFCNIQVFQAQTETNPFAVDDNEELLERLKNKERDPMSMSFYQEKDDDTCERLLGAPDPVDLNAVQPLPDCDDEPAPGDRDKENASPRPALMELLAAANHEPQDAMQTDTPESHKLLFEQIPEIPDGKSSELGFNYEDGPDQLRGVTPQENHYQDIDMEYKPESPRVESASMPSQESQDRRLDLDHLERSSPEFVRATESDNHIMDSHSTENHDEHSNDRLPPSPGPVADNRCAEAITPEFSHEFQENIKAEIHNFDRVDENFDDIVRPHSDAEDVDFLQRDVNLLTSDIVTQEFLPVAASPSPCEVPASPAPREPSPSPAVSPISEVEPIETLVPAKSPVPETLAPCESPLLAASPAPRSPLPAEPTDSPLPAISPSPVEAALPVESPVPRMSPVPAHAESPSSPRAESPAPVELEPRPETASPLAAAPSPCLAPSPCPVPAPAVAACLTPEVPHEDLVFLNSQEHARVPETSGPAPDIVPEERNEQSHREIVTDIDIGIPESHAQEICVPVTNEIVDEGVQPAAGTPPPTPAAEPAPAEPLAAAGAGAAAGVAAAVGVAAAATAAISKAKSPAKKFTTTPASKTTAPTKPASKVGTTPASAAKKTATTPPAARPAPVRTSLAKTPSSAAKPKSAATPTAAVKPSPRPVPKSAPAKESPSAPRTAPAPRAAPKAPAARPASAAPAPRAPPAPAPRAPPARAALAARPTAAAARPASAPAPRPAATRTPAAPRPAARPAPRPAPAATKPRETKAPEKQPLTNGDVKAAAPAPIRKAPLPARPAPRPAPRPATAPATQAPAVKAAAPKPAARAAPRAPLDKQTKDLANRRITAKGAPPRTVATKTVPTSKSAAAAKGAAPPGAPALLNGAEPKAAAAGDGALLPDVIA